MPDLTLSVPQGLVETYCNQFYVQHTPSEVYLDGFVLGPGQRRVDIKVRLVMHPATAKALERTLARNIAKYEETYGVIPLPGDTDLVASLFNPPEGGDGTS